MPRFEPDYELHKAGLKELPYEPLDEAVRFVTKFRNLRLPIVPAYEEVVRGRPYVINGIRAGFLNG